MKYLKVAVAAAALASSPLLAHDPKDPIETAVDPLFDAVLAEDMSAVSEVIADGAMVHAMFNPNGETGEGSIRSFPATAYFGIVTANYENIEFVDRTYTVSEDKKTVWMEANGNLRVAETGTPYRNRYVFKITINDDGKVANIAEWVNTATLIAQGRTAQSQ
ncbi:nuclear transport factor 2 family protein [uncultured Erythrobacter sp.]|uniref:nuclear transport factor 2 family protein n=1 Tax=uncultured Erythrobacter sp. TaxID=263913 RepID=UPI00262D0B7F|nr:nuclear transport factor 2 family protein [uncultured Erythrobacter sp.]